MQLGSAWDVLGTLGCQGGAIEIFAPGLEAQTSRPGVT